MPNHEFHNNFEKSFISNENNKKNKLNTQLFSFNENPFGKKKLYYFATVAGLLLVPSHFFVFFYSVFRVYIQYALCFAVLTQRYAFRSSFRCFSLY